MEDSNDRTNISAWHIYLASLGVDLHLWCYVQQKPIVFYQDLFWGIQSCTRQTSNGILLAQLWNYRVVPKNMSRLSTCKSQTNQDRIQHKDLSTVPSGGIVVLLRKLTLWQSIQDRHLFGQDLRTRYSWDVSNYHGLQCKTAFAMLKPSDMSMFSPR